MAKAAGIIGGGISGLYTAIGLVNRGWRVVVFEKDITKEHRSQGYAIALEKSKGLHALRENNISDDEIAKISRNTSSGMTYKRPDGTNLMKTVSKPTDPWFTVQVNRQKLRDLLLSKLPDGCVQWGKCAVDMKVDAAQKKVIFDFGSEVSEEFDFGVVADGSSSALRRHFGQGDLRTFHGSISIQGALPSKHPAEAAIREYVSSGGCFIKPVFGVFFAKYIAAEEEDTSLLWSFAYPTTKEEYITLKNKGTACAQTHVLKNIESLPAAIRAVVESTDPGSIHIRANEDVDPVMINPYPGIVTAIGDSVHPMMPYRGQGANLALLDAMELLAVLSDESSSATLEDRITAFEAAIVQRGLQTIGMTRSTLFALMQQKEFQFDDVLDVLKIPKFPGAEKFLGYEDPHQPQPSL